MAITYLSGGRLQGNASGSTLSLDTSYSTNTVRHDMHFLNTGQSNVIASNEYAGNVIDTNHESIGKKLTSVTYRLNQTGTDNTDRPVVKLYTTGGVHKSTFTCEMNYGDMPSTANYVTNVEFKWSSNESGQDNEVDEDDEMRLYATNLASATLRIFSCDQSSETTAAKLHETDNGTENTGAFYPCEMQYDEPNKIIDGSDTVLIFRKNGTFTPSANFNVEVLVVGGGGAGGAGSVSGGGGAGGMSEKASHSVTSGTAYSVIVGEGGKAGAAGGIAANSNSKFQHRAQNGGNSSFDGIISQGGGAGSGVISSYRTGFDGGSGGGTWYSAGGSGGSSTQGDTNSATGYGEAGGVNDGGTYTTGGGGGASEVGKTWTNGQSRGGNGRQNDITGVNKYYAGGGGGGSHGSGIASGTGGKGGLGGGGQGTDGVNSSPVSNKMLEHGVNGLGGGGGGNNNEKRWGDASGIHVMSQYYGVDGGDGVVILRFSTSGNTYTATFESPDSDLDSADDVPVGTLFEDTSSNRIYRKAGSAITVSSPTHSGATNRGLGQDNSGQVTKFGMQVVIGSTLIGKTVKSMSFYLWKGSSPTGNGYMQVVDGHGKVVANSTNTIDWSTLGTSANGTKQTFNFNGHKIRPMDCFLIVGGSTSTSNIVYVSRHSSNNSDNSNVTWYWNNDDYRGYADEPVRYEMTHGNGWVEKGTA